MHAISYQIKHVAQSLIHQFQTETMSSNDTHARLDASLRVTKPNRKRASDWLIRAWELLSISYALVMAGVEKPLNR